MNRRRRQLLQLLAASCALPAAQAAAQAAAPAGASPVSAAENDLFVADHLANVGDARRLVYELERTEGGRPPESERIELRLGEPNADGSRPVRVQFSSTAHGLSLPDIESARGNPVVLAFLERDVRIAQRVTGGQAAHFRRRLRMALADDATVTEIGTEFGGRQVRARLIMATPFANDLNRARYGAMADKSYRFLLSPEVPGWVVELRTLVRDASSGTSINETMRLVEARP